MERWSRRFGLGVPPSTGLREALQWLMFARLGVAYAVLSALVTNQVFHRDQPDGGALALGYFLVAVCFAWNFLQAIFLEKIPAWSGWGAANLCFDSLLISVWIAHAPGRESFFALLFLIQVLAASLTFFQKGAWIATFLSSACLGVVLAIAHTPYGWGIWLSYSALFLVVGAVGGYLSEELLRTSLSLKDKSVRMERLMAMHARIVSSLPTGLLTVDSQMKIAFVNPAGESILGVVGQEIVGKELSHAAAGLLPFFEQIEARKLAEEPEQDIRDQATEVAATGTEHHRSIFLKPLSQKGKARLQQRVELGKGAQQRVLRGDVAELDADAGLSGLLGESATGGRILLFQDVTKLVHLEEKLKQNEKLAAVGQLAAGIAHEIRNPLASMSASIEMLKSSWPKEMENLENHQLMDIAIREIDRLNRLISEFLDFVKPEKITFLAVDLAALLSEVALATRGLRGFEGKIVLRENFTPAIAHGSREKLKQVVWNLVTNAMQAMPQGGQLEMGCQPVSDQWVKFWVEDQGVGMGEEVLTHLYEPFFTTKDKGTGLGLATAYKIVETHHGEIRVRSAVGQGTRFEIILPGA